MCVQSAKAWGCFSFSRLSLLLQKNTSVLHLLNILKCKSCWIRRWWWGERVNINLLPPESQPHPAKTNTRPLEHTSAILHVLHNYLYHPPTSTALHKYLYHILLPLHRTIIFTILYAQEDKDEYIFISILFCYYFCSMIFFFISRLWLQFVFLFLLRMGNHPEIGNYQVCRDRPIYITDILAILSQIYTFWCPFWPNKCTPKLTNIRQAHRYIGEKRN